MYLDGVVRHLYFMVRTKGSIHKFKLIIREFQLHLEAVTFQESEDPVRLQKIW